MSEEPGDEDPRGEITFERCEILLASGAVDGEGPSGSRARDLRASGWKLGTTCETKTSSV